MNHRRGANAMEFALCLPFVLLAIVSMADFAMWMLARHAVSRAVQDASVVAGKLAVPNGDDDGTYLIDQTKQMMQDSMGLWGSYQGAIYRATWEPDDDGIMWLRASVELPFEPLMGTMSPFNNPVERHFVMLTLEQPN